MRAAGGLITIVALLVLATSLFSQANQGTVEGTVFDESGSVIAGAKVTVVDIARGVSHALTADSAGAYVAQNLIPGTYMVRGEANGFRTLEHANILLEVGQTVRIDLVLQPGQQTETVQVTGEAPAINTTDATLGGTIESQTITDLPLNGRNFKDLLGLRPGVTVMSGGGFDVWSGNGTRAEDVGYLIDGLRMDEAFTGQSVVNGPLVAGDSSTSLPIDSIQEINNEENPKAEVGWKPGAIVNVGLKSGTNDFHGSAIAFGRDTALDARNFFDTVPLPDAPVTLEQFGASAGGRIKKDKLFWFGDYEGQRYTVGSTSTVSVPAAVSLGGDVQNSLVDACLDLNKRKIAINPLSAQISGLNTTTCTVRPTNYTPGPNESLFPTNTGSAPIFLGLISGNRNDNGVGKLDYHINDHNSVSGTYFYGIGSGTWNTVGGLGGSHLGLPGSSNSPWLELIGPVKTQLAEGSWNWVPSSTRTNEFRIGYDRFYQPYASVDHNVNPLAYGINTGVTNPRYFGFPIVSITGFSGQLGENAYKVVGPDSSFQLLDHYTILHGDHTFKFGGEFIYNNIDVDSTGNVKGVFKFSNLENFLQGKVNGGGNKIIVGDPTRNLSDEQYALFAQDDWRMSRRVTLNLGLRWEYQSVLKDSQDRLGGFDPTLGLTQVGNQISAPYNADYRGFSPRVGIAWDLRGDGKTVLRAGGSLMYSYLPAISFISIAQQVGISLNPTAARIITQQTGPAGLAGAGTIGVATVSIPGSKLTPGWQAQTAACVNGGTTSCGPIVPSSIFNLQCGDGVSGDPSPCNVTFVDPNFRTPYVGTWTLGLQHALTNNLSLDVAYVGTHGDRMAGFLEINQPPLGSGYAAADIAAGDPSAVDPQAEQQARPFYSKFPYLAYINEIKNVDRSNYNAMQATLTQRTSHGLSFLLGYTFAHALDDSPTNEFIFVPLDSTHPGRQYGDSEYDIRHTLSFSVTYALPGVKSPGQLLEGWQISSLVTLQSSGPWSLQDSADDFSGTGELNNFDPYGETWDFSGNHADFKSTNVPIPCWSGSGGAALPGCTIQNEPQACIAAASAINANTVAALNSVGCYIKGNSVLIPPALGTFGTAGRNIFRDSGFRNWDFSIAKNWKFKERLTGQFKADFFNVLNHPNFYSPNGIANAGFNDPSAGPSGDFGCGCLTPDQASSNPVLGSGSNRAIQLGMKLIF